MNMIQSPVQTNECINKLELKQQIIDRAPFRLLKINDASALDTVQGREICGKCFKSRKFFCYTCCTPVIDSKYFPRVKVRLIIFIIKSKNLILYFSFYLLQLPIKIDIIKHAKETDGKSTAIHAVILAPEDVTIYTYPDFPKFAANDKVNKI